MFEVACNTPLSGRVATSRLWTSSTKKLEAPSCQMKFAAAAVMMAGSASGQSRARALDPQAPVREGEARELLIRGNDKGPRGPSPIPASLASPVQRPSPDAR